MSETMIQIALRCFTLIEFQVRQSLQTLQIHLVGLYAGNPKRKTERPSAEQLLKAFVGMVPLKLLLSIAYSIASWPS